MTLAWSCCEACCWRLCTYHWGLVACLSFFLVQAVAQCELSADCVVKCAFLCVTGRGRHGLPKTPTVLCTGLCWDGTLLVGQHTSTGGMLRFFRDPID